VANDGARSSFTIAAGDSLLAVDQVDSGQLLAAAQIDGAPAGITPIHHPDGWVGRRCGAASDPTS
jgi:hypothetical protein